MAAFFIGFQILLRELCLLTGRYNISVGKAQSVTYVSSLVSLALMLMISGPVEAKEITKL